ncbi:YfhO family protein [Hymenobacter chitinivorans]|uniref:Membrane protein YfhO n=1 Tax=Hymenobacter chitinivorans DSM 11115 TaxID=1121954 RepID=A0A2M9ASN6_9BACT|nr:YfhO family protein [Hymenobacter chitinivorans]PJJ48687.1 membrane protein YfhO [Hymenobacter chitinivorans DSM 11115]
MTTVSSPAVPLWRRLLPHLLAVVFFLVLAAVYFSPILFDGKTLAQHDVVQFNGGAHEAQLYREATGKEALWTNSMFSGMPTYLISTRFPGDLSIYLHNIFTLHLPAVVANLFLALLCGYVLFVALGVRPLLAAIGAIALGFTSYNLIILAAGHNTKSLALAYAPLVLGGLLVTFRRNRWLGAALFALGLTMNVRSNHLQITYYLLLLVLVFGIVELIAALREKRLSDFLGRSALLAAAAVLAVGVSFGRLYVTAEYGKYSIRGKSELTTPAPTAPGAPAQAAGEDGGAGNGLDRDYAFGWSYGVGETITLLIPNYYGGASGGSLSENSATGKALAGLGVPPVQLRDYLQQLPLYWGDQPITSGPVYIGAVVCFLFVLGLFVADRRTRTWLLVGTILSIVLAWGKNFETFNYLMFDYFPGYNKFRSVSMALVIAQLAMPLLAILALARVLRAQPAVAPVAGASTHPSLAALSGATAASPEQTELKRKVLYAVAITAGICVLAFLAGLGADFAAPVDAQLQQQQFPLDALREDRASLMRTDVFRSIIFIVLTGGVLYFYLQRKLSVTMAGLLVGALTLVDLWSVDKRYLNDSNFQSETIAQQFVPTPADEQILQDKDLSYRVLNMQNPFNEANTSYFHKSIGGYHGAKLRRYQDLIERQISANNLQVLAMLNTRYIITGDPKQPVQRNPAALGNAWFVSEVQKVQNPDQEIAALTTLNVATTAVVDASKFPLAKTTYNAAGSTIALTNYSPDELKYRTTAVQDGFVVFSEIYYQDGWNAYLDGKLVPHLRANYVLRALPVPAGTHTIEFKFEPKEYAVGNTVSMISSVLLILTLLGTIFYALKRQPTEPAEEARLAA